MRNPLGLALLFSALAAAPTHAQRSSSQPLREYTGKTVPYRIGIPANWQLAEDGNKLTASRGRVMLIFATVDVGTIQAGSETQLPAEEIRRATTAALLASDSLLLMIVDRMFPSLEATPGFHCTRQFREIRELGGQRAGFIRIRCDLARGDSARFEGWMTIKHGVMYSLTFIADPSAYPANEPIFSRIRESVVLPDSAPAAPAEPPAVSPAPAAQPSLLQLREHVGRGIAYRLSIPAGWTVTDHGEVLEARNGEVAIYLVARNVRGADAARYFELQLSASESRGLSGATTPPESLLLKLADRFSRPVDERPGAHCTQLSREIRAMAGHRAGFRSTECVLVGGNSVRLETRSIVTNGTLYALTFMAEVSDFDASELLFDRVRESLVLAPTTQRLSRE